MYIFNRDDGLFFNFGTSEKCRILFVHPTFRRIPGVAVGRIYLRGPTYAMYEYTIRGFPFVDLYIRVT